MSSSPYITTQGMAYLNQELEGRWKRRRDVVKALSAAAELAGCSAPNLLPAHAAHLNMAG